MVVIFIMFTCFLKKCVTINSGVPVLMCNKIEVFLKRQDWSCYDIILDQRFWFLFVSDLHLPQQLRSMNWTCPLRV